MINFSQKRIGVIALFTLSFVVLTVLPFNKVQAGVCGDLILLKNGVAVSETGASTIPGDDKANWQLKITSARTRSTCAHDYMRVILNFTGLDGKKTTETIIAAQSIVSTNVNKTIKLATNIGGTYRYDMQTSSDEKTFNPSISNSLAITVTGNNLPPANSPANNSPTSNPVEVPPIKNIVGGKTLSGLISQGINILLTLIVIAAVIVIIIAGFRMATAGGNPDQITKAKKTLIWAILGLVVAFMSFAIVRIVQGLL